MDGTKDRRPHRFLGFVIDACSTGATGGWRSVVIGDTVGSLAHDSISVAVPMVSLACWFALLVKRVMVL